MSAFLRFRTLLMALVIPLLAISRSSGRSVYIQDSAGFFSEHARAEASRTIAELERSAKKEVVVETYGELPADVRESAGGQDKAAIDRAMGQWATKEARQKQVNGVYMMLVKNPAHLQVVVGNDTQKQAFTLSDRDALVSMMLTRLRARQNDGALLEGVDFVANTMRSHLGVGGHPATVRTSPVHRETSTSWGILPIILVVGVVWVVFGLIRSLFRGGGGGVMGGGGGGYGGSPMMGGGGGGGGFFSSLLGGMFGSAAGMWMYDQFSGRSNSAGAATPETREVDSPTYTGQDTDYSSSGGGFGDDSGGGSGTGSGGGDFGGGGDSGGDDFGGGDSGGGGGDFGGGGDSGGGGGGDF